MAAERKSVVLEVWGRTEFDMDRARQDATVEAAARGWEIADVEQSAGGRNPIPRRDHGALAQFGHYNRAWVMRPAADATEAVSHD